MATIRVTDEGRINAYTMPEMKRRILTELLFSDKREGEFTSKLVNILRDKYIEYRNLPIKNFMQAMVDLHKIEYVEFVE